MPCSQIDPPPEPSAAAGERLWVVLPVHDEAAAIERVLAEWVPVLAAADPGFVLLAIDDGSTDATPAILARLARDEPRIRILSGPNRGHGAACLRGYRLATSPDSDAAWILQVDSDGQCDPADFAAFWGGRREHAVQLGRRRRGDGLLRAATSRLLAVLVSAVAGRRVRDANVPYRLLACEVLAGALARLTGRPVRLVNAALAIVCCELGPVRWVPVGFRQRFAGRSHYRPPRLAALAGGLLAWQARRAPGRALAVLAWAAVAVAVTVYAAHNLGDPTLWYDEAVQVHTALGLDPMAPPFTPPGTLRDVVVRNAIDELDPGGFGVLLHAWILIAGTGVAGFRLVSGLLVLAGLAALAALAGRWLRHPLAPPAAIALALADPLVREQALEVRPYALELAATWIALWAADRLLARPGGGRALVLSAALVGLLGGRYSGFLTAGALAGVLAIELLPAASARRGGPPARRRRKALATALLPPLCAAAVIARWSVPGLVHRSAWGGGTLIDYLRPHTLEGLAPFAAAATALRNLVHPTTLALTVAAGLALLPGTVLGGRLAPPMPSSRLVRRTALLVLAATVLLWRWHPWDPATKWSLYLHAVSLVALLRLVADVLPRISRRPLGRRLALAVAVAAVGAGVFAAAAHQRWRWDVALPALERIGSLEGVGPAAPVVVDVLPLPAVRYHYELGTLAGRPEYPGAFRFAARSARPSRQALCDAGWLLSFDAVRDLEERYPGFGFTEDSAADQLLAVRPPRGEDSGCGGRNAAGTFGAEASEVADAR